MRTVLVGDVHAGEPERSGRLRRGDRLLDGRDFRRVSRRGRRTAGRAFVLLVAGTGPTGESGGRRVGISASRRVGNAVVRNRVKRGIREWFRQRRQVLPKDVDIVVIARRPAAELGGQAIAEALDELAARSRRLDTKPDRTRR